MSDNPMSATVENTADGHGAQFTIALHGGVRKIPHSVLRAIVSEARSRAALYVDSISVVGDDVIISIGRGNLLLARVDHHYNHLRADEKFRVILRDEMDSGENKNPTILDEGSLTALEESLLAHH